MTEPLHAIVIGDNPPSRALTKPCVRCGAALTRRRKKSGKWESVPEFTGRQFCSRACANSRLAKAEPDHPPLCQQCGVPLLRKRRPCGGMESIPTLMRRRFCNATCMGRFAAPDGAKPVCVANAGHNKARRRKKRVCCERCGSGERLEVHHKDKNPSNNETSNLEVLCVPCHKKHHKSERPAKTCRICGGKHAAKGLCSKHWQRMRAHGDPLVVLRQRKSQA